MKLTKLAIIGGGVMAEAFLNGMTAKKTVDPASVIVGEPIAQRRAYLARYGVATTDDNQAAVASAEVVLLAVKPQVVGDVMKHIAGSVPSDALVMSIVAGLPIAAIQRTLPASSVVRVMPNTPAQSGEGMSVWVKSPEVTPDQAAWVQTVLASLGDELQLPSEKYLDMATAVSGSGPAYVFLFVESLADAGVRLGLNRDIALRLAWQTVRGAAAYGQASQKHPAELRNMVTSPGGTTAEALHALEQAAFRAAIAEAVQACYEKALELGRTSA